jgi:Ca2+-binding RTX toxin-like protein
MTGGGGNDAFGVAGNDIITDFTVGADRLLLPAGVTIAAFEQQALGGGAALDTLVTLSDGDTVTLLDTLVNASQLQLLA